MPKSDHPAILKFPAQAERISGLLESNEVFACICRDYAEIVGEITTQERAFGHSSGELADLLEMKHGLESDILDWMEKHSEMRRVRQSDMGVRVNAHLLRSDTGEHIRSERYEGSPDDFPVFQGKIAKMVADAVAVSLAVPDQQISLADPDARSMATTALGSGAMGIVVDPTPIAVLRRKPIW